MSPPRTWPVVASALVGPWYRRAQLRLERGDRAGARSDADRAIGLHSLSPDHRLPDSALVGLLRAALERDPARTEPLVKELVLGRDECGP